MGHNGAGKTTTMRMLTAQLTPTEGQLRVAGWMWSQTLKAPEH